MSPTTSAAGTYGRAVRAARQAAGLKIVTLAHLAGCDRSMISHIEAGNRVPAPDLARAIDIALRAEGALLRRWEQSVNVVRTRGRQRPRQLPAAPPRLIGVEAVLADLDEAVGSGGPVVITGPAGVGKTAVALHWAHRHQPQWPDGALVLNLRGRAPQSAPRSAGVLLGDLLADLLPGRTRLPTDTDRRASLLRHTLHGRRLLLLLDDAFDADQLRPLLGIYGVTVLITSRATLPGLAITHHAAHVMVPPLSTTAAVRLLRVLLGQRASDADETLAAIAAGCGHLPLALLAAGQRVLARPGDELDAIAIELTGPGRLSWLHAAAGGDQRSSVRTALDISARTLSPAARTLLRRAVGEAPLTLARAAELVNSSAEQTAGLLDELSREHLLIATADGYRYPPLVHAWASNPHYS